MKLTLNGEELLLGMPSLPYIVKLIKEEEIKFQKKSVELLVREREKERECTEMRWPGLDSESPGVRRRGTGGGALEKIVEQEWRLQGLQELQIESSGVWRARLGFGGDGESTTPLLVVLVTPWDSRERESAQTGFRVLRVLGWFLEKGK